MTRILLARRTIALLTLPMALAAQRGAAPDTLPQRATMTIEQARDEQIHPPLPLKHKPEPTAANITAADLMTRLYIFADDSMMGRETGTVGHVRATNYIAGELKKLGLKPAGDSGTYFQNVPVILRMLDSNSSIMVEGKRYAVGSDFLAVSGGGRGGGGATPAVAAFPSGQIIYGGVQGDTSAALTSDQVAGKIVLLRGAAGGGGRGGGGAGGRGGGGRGGGGRGANGPANPLASAAGILTIVDVIASQQVATALHPREGSAVLRAPAAGAPAVVPTVTVTPTLAEALLGTPLANAKKGQLGKTMQANVRFIDAPRPARNVVAILPGADEKLKGEYVAIGAHNDHIGIRQGPPLDHDSVRIYNAILRTQGLENRQPLIPTPAQAIALKAALDSVHKVHGVRLDSISNGADDDGSGSVVELEIAEKFAKTQPRPKRSILFVFHVGEEKGLWGSDFFTQFPTVPRDSIVAQLNMDMVGRGKAEDIPGGGPEYVEPVGWKRLSSELGVLALQTNAKEKPPFQFDSVYDAPFQTNDIYCRSDHANYARFGIPISYFTTGLHRDYHQVTDEPQYIDYPHMARVGQFMYDLAVATANAPHRPIVDGNVPKDPLAQCRNNGVVPDSLALPHKPPPRK